MAPPCREVALYRVTIIPYIVCNRNINYCILLYSVTFSNILGRIYERFCKGINSFLTPSADNLHFGEQGAALRSVHTRPAGTHVTL